MADSLHFLSCQLFAAIDLNHDGYVDREEVGTGNVVFLLA